jgi:hypothetical protein
MYGTSVPIRPLTFDDVKDRIDNSYPIGANIKWLGDKIGSHFEVITGYYEKNDVQYIVYNDPLIGETSMSFAQYLSNREFSLQEYVIIKEYISNIPTPDTDYEVNISDRFETFYDNDNSSYASDISNNGTTISGSIGVNGDTTDYYRIFAPTANKTVTVSMLSAPANTVVELYKSTQSGFTKVAEFNNVSSLDYVLEPIYGNYYVKVYNSSNSGNYSLKVSYPAP